MKKLILLPFRIVRLVIVLVLLLITLIVIVLRHGPYGACDRLSILRHKLDEMVLAKQNVKKD